MSKVCLLILSLAGAVFAQSAGSIKTTILASGGKTIPGIYVVATPMGPGGGRTLTAITDSTGNATFPSVPAATYMLCVQGPGTAYLDPCRWDKPVQVTVAAGQQVSAVVPPINTGSVLRVRLDDDPSKHYLAQGGNRPDPLIGVLTPGKMYHPLRVASKDDNGRTLDIAIPLNTAMQLLVHPGGWQLADEKGLGVGAPARAGDPPTTASIAVTHTSNGNNPDVRFRVTGVR